MTRPDSHELYEELAAGYALSALEPEDEQEFLRHLSACARCERDTAVHAATLTHLAYAADAPEPPESLLSAIRRGVAASGRGASFPPSAPRTLTDAPEPAAPYREPAPVASLDDARRRKLRFGPARPGAWVGIAAAAALVMGLGVWNTSLQADRDQQDAWGDRITAAVRELRDTSTDTVPLTTPEGDVVAVALVRGSELSLVVDGLPVNDEATTYILWGQSRYGDVRPVGAFDVTRPGVDVREDMQVQAGVADVTRFMLTRERGSQAPPIPEQPLLASGDV